ncbi:MAG: sterol desaturase family protein [Alphaproteobacteria bacterium]|nr:sterol desaturase family protein [Alphaproteobacteria bacterium]
MDPALLDRLVTLAVPSTYGLAVLLIVGELVVLRRRGVALDHATGRVSLLSGLLSFGGLAVAGRLVYAGVLEVAWAHRLTDLGLGAWAWGVGFLAYDAVFYVGHRAAHEVRLLWCFHVTHHTSEQMRLSSAVRGSAFDFVYSPWFHVWLPLVGLHPGLVLVVETGSKVWGVLEHVSPDLTGRWGWLDRVLVTPSAHRVHHGRNAPYLDRNYGEILLVWDHLLGTFAEEEEVPDYGVLAPIDSRSLDAVQLGPWRSLWHDLRRAPGWGARLRYLFDAPGWRHDGPDERVRAKRRAMRPAV